MGAIWGPRFFAFCAWCSDLRVGSAIFRNTEVRTVLVLALIIEKACFSEPTPYSLQSAGLCGKWGRACGVWKGLREGLAGLFCTCMLAYITEACT